MTGQPVLVFLATRQVNAGSPLNASEINIEHIRPVGPGKDLGLEAGELPQMLRDDRVQLDARIGITLVILPAGQHQALLQVQVFAPEGQDIADTPTAEIAYDQET